MKKVLWLLSQALSAKRNISNNVRPAITCVPILTLSFSTQQIMFSPYSASYVTGHLINLDLQIKVSEMKQTEQAKT
jgi:hypothetical protein